MQWCLKVFIGKPTAFKNTFLFVQQVKTYRHAETEAAVRQYWHTRKTYDRVKQKNAGKERFVFLDGPPYTSGKVHIGTAWNKVLKDLVLRAKRLQGYDVWDRAGYDMHGLPTEQPTMKKLGLHTSEDIERYGVDKFTAACKALCLENMAEMNAAFEQLGVWMDFENAYQPVTPAFISSVWYLIGQAHKQQRLYKGLRTMAWDSVFETACAKHELTYENVTDMSIYVKFKRAGTPNEYFVIWTTTPWTIPFNLAIMVNPNVEYSKVRVGNELWIVASDLLDAVIAKAADKEYAVISTMRGADLAGESYEHPFAERVDYSQLKTNHSNVHTIVLSSEYVTTDSGSGLVHCAPGCGPEDYEVGIQNDLPAYNTVRPDGTFGEPFHGLKAREDDKTFITLLEDAGAIAAKERYTHEYPHSERSKAPVIFRTTAQWFFRVSDLKDAMLAANESIEWQPLAAKNAFHNWLANLRDNSITKQRYWGTPVPIWTNDETGETIVVSSIAELEALSGSRVTDAHRPWIDAITIPSKKHPGTVLSRIPDVLDVWVDAGSASWNHLDYPHRTDLLATHYPAAFILEGKDQIRGWFNLLMVAGMIAFGKPSFKAVYMHGFINDRDGRKMSKSLGNSISPNEVIPHYGVDAFRLHMIGATAPGLDLNYNATDVETSHKNLLVLWNTVQYLIDACRTNELTPKRITADAAIDDEERYILSRLATTTTEVTAALAAYNLPRIPALVQSLFLEVSRTYIQLVREKTTGDDAEKQLVVDTLYTLLHDILILLSPVCPFITESLWQDMHEHGDERSSIHEQSWPTADTAAADPVLEAGFGAAQQLITAGFACREQLKTGVRWPLAHLAISADPRFAQFTDLIKRQVNVKHVTWNDFAGMRTMKPAYGSLGKTFGRDTQRVAALIEKHHVVPPATIEGFAILPEHVIVHTTAPEGYVTTTCAAGTVYAQQAVTDELIEEGFSRELTRRVQQLRKDLGLQKRDRIMLCITGKHSLSSHHREELLRKTNATLALEHLDEQKHEHIRDRTYTISAQKTI